MTVTAIRCEACEGIGLVEEPGWWGPNGGRIPEVIECPLCDGTGFETPPVPGPENRARVGGAAANTRSAAAPLTDDDKRAQQAIEGTKYENL